MTFYFSCACSIKIYVSLFSNINMCIQIDLIYFCRGALHRQNADFNAAIDDFLLAMDKADHDELSTTYKEAQRQLLLCYNDFAVECFR